MKRPQNPANREAALKRLAYPKPWFWALVIILLVLNIINIFISKPISIGWWARENWELLLFYPSLIVVVIGARRALARHQKTYNS